VGARKRAGIQEKALEAGLKVLNPKEIRAAPAEEPVEEEKEND
jgi:hypothetical protein